MKQLGLLDFDICLNDIDNSGAPLASLYETVYWEVFRPILKEVREMQNDNASPLGLQIDSR